MRLSEAWKAEQARLAREANAKRSEAAREQHKVSNPRMGETKPVSGAATTSGATKTEKPAPADKRSKVTETKAALSGTNRGAVERMDKLASVRIVSERLDRVKASP